MNETIRQPIRNVWLALNYLCNNRCMGCYAAGSGFVNRSMDVQTAIRAMTWTRELGAFDCLLIGGEPTLYKEIETLIKAGADLGLQMKLVTNGRRLSDLSFLKRLIDSGLTHASISIEGATAATHNLVTQTNSYGEVISAIKNCMGSGLSFNTLMTISETNCEEIVTLAETLHGIGVKHVLYNIGLPSPGTSPGPANEFALDPRVVAQYITDAYLALRLKGIGVKFFGTIPLCLFEENILAAMISDGYIGDGIHCHIFYGSGVAFEPDGSVLPCTHFVGHRLFNLNDHRLKSALDFADFWYGEQGMHGAFKAAVWRYPHERCKTCSHWGKCVGGCPFLWTRFDPQEVIGGRNSP